MQYRDLARALLDSGCTPKEGKGDHQKWYCPCGKPEEIAASLHPNVDAGCRTFNLIPLADTQELVIEGATAVRAALNS